jgi:hypothetical protein
MMPSFAQEKHFPMEAKEWHICRMKQHGGNSLRQFKLLSASLTNARDSWKGKSLALQQQKLRCHWYN